MEITRRPGHYRVEFCGAVLAQDDNPDGRDIENTIDQIETTCDWIKGLTSVASGVVVGYGVNVALRLMYQPRREDVE